MESTTNSPIPEARPDYTEKKQELEVLIAEFEKTYSIGVLKEIKFVSSLPKDIYNLRENAKKALKDISSSLSALQKTNIPKDEYDNIRAEYIILNKAVGFKTGDKVDHSIVS